MSITVLQILRMMDVISLLKLLSLILIANAAPVIIRYFLKERCSFPLDGGLLLADRRPLLGRSKTIRGVVVAIAGTGLIAPLLGVAIQTGLAIGILAMTGDLLSSFIKRRIGIPPSSEAPVLDQVPESLLPAMVVGRDFALGWVEVLLVVGGFTCINLLVSRLLLIVAVHRS